MFNTNKFQFPPPKFLFLNKMSSPRPARKNRKDLKGTVLGKLIKCQNQILDDNNKTFKPISIKLKDFEKLKLTPTAVEVIEKEPTAKESPQVKAYREQLTSLVEGVVDDVDINGEQIILVNVKTPAVDLEKDLNEEQLTFIKGDIFKSIQSQLGAEFHQQTEEQWGIAFNTMMEIVKTQKDSNWTQLLYLLTRKIYIIWVKWCM